MLDLQLAVQMRDDHLAECQRQSEMDQQQIDELERQVLMQVGPLCCLKLLYAGSNRGSATSQQMLRQQGFESLSFSLKIGHFLRSLAAM